MASIMEGPLSKWTNVMKGWQYRWFVLDYNAGLLSYYTASLLQTNMDRTLTCPVHLALPYYRGPASTQRVDGSTALPSTSSSNFGKNFSPPPHAVEDEGMTRIGVLTASTDNSSRDPLLTGETPLWESPVR